MKSGAQGLYQYIIPDYQQLLSSVNDQWKFVFFQQLWSWQIPDALVILSEEEMGLVVIICFQGT